jgi:phosphate-selective porin
MSKNGLILLKPTTVDKTGGGSETATISANGSVEFSACATLSLNGVFSADYDNYRVVMWNSANQADNIYLRLRLSGADNSTASSYVYQQLDASSTTVAGSRTTSNQALVHLGGNVQRAGVVVDLYGPYLAQATAGRAVNVWDSSSARLTDHAFTHNQTVAYDGLSLICGAGTNVSGRVAVYGMRK